MCSAFQVRCGATSACAVGHTDAAAAGTNVYRVAGLGCIGMLAGAAVLGWLTHLVTLNHTFLLHPVPRDHHCCGRHPAPRSGPATHRRADLLTS